MKHLFVGNPMFAELERQKRTALATRNWRGGSLAGRVILILLYTYLLGLVFTNPDDVEPLVMLYILLIVVCIAMPATLHGAIAGDREKRSLDLLLVSPVTPGQIAIGKLARGIAVLVVASVAILAPSFIVELLRASSSNEYYAYDSFGLIGFLRAVGLIVAVGLFFATLSLAVSSTTKSITSSMLTIIGVLFVLYVLMPLFAGVLVFFDPRSGEWISGMHPFVALYNTYARSTYAYGGPERSSVVAMATLTTLVHLGGAAILFLIARNNIAALSRGRK